MKSNIRSEAKPDPGGTGYFAVISALQDGDFFLANDGKPRYNKPKQRQEKIENFLAFPCYFGAERDQVRAPYREIGGR